MKLIVLLCWLSAWGSALFAQAFNTHWIGVPEPDSTSHFRFRQTYMFQGRPQEGHITIASTGLYKIYVNECNVGTAVFYDTNQPNKTNIASKNFDVTPYLKADTNVIAVLYAPRYPHVETRQLSVNFYGCDVNGQRFSYHTDENWLCQQANSTINTNGGETIDGRKNNLIWKAATFDLALWRNAERFKDSPPLAIACISVDPNVLKIVSRRNYKFFDLTPNGVEYEFGTGFHGYVRLTLRNAKKGQRIRFGNHVYICNGELDEQAAPQFAIGDYRRVLVSGDKDFARELITDIEAIGVAPKIDDAVSPF